MLHRGVALLCGSEARDARCNMLHLAWLIWVLYGLGHGRSQSPIPRGGPLPSGVLTIRTIISTTIPGV